MVWKCKICGKEINYKGKCSDTHIKCHIQRIHKMYMDEYCNLYYKNLTPDFKLEKCGFCEKDAIPEMDVDIINETYSFNYSKGYLCKTDECRNNISLLIFNEPYNDRYEYIGSNSTYLSLLHKKPIEDIKYSKAKGYRENRFSTSKEGFIEKYGEEDGTKRYLDRNKKVSKGSTIHYYIEKYGEIEGKKKWDARINKIKNKMLLGSSVSKAQKEINKFLDNLNIKYEIEVPIILESGKHGFVDFYLPEYNIIIEYYGIFWHCHPSYYKEDYYHKLKKMYAKDIWDHDNKRINHIFNKCYNKNVSILIIWERSITQDELLETLNKIKSTNTIYYHG